MPKLSFIKGTLVLEGADNAWLQQVDANIPWRWDYRSQQWRTDALYYRVFRDAYLQWSGSTTVAEGDDSIGIEVAEANAASPSLIALEDQVPRWQPLRWPQLNLPQLRPDQQEAVNAWSSTRRGYVVMATGTGKTEVAIAAIERLKTSTLVVAPVRDLMYQWHRRLLDRLGYDSGLIGDQRWHVQPLSVTTYDSACLHMDKLGDRFELIVFDECHHLPGAMRRESALMSAAPYRLGLTATPERRDGGEADLEQLIGPSVYRLGIRQAAGQQLADYRVVRIPVELTPDERERYAACSETVRQYVAQRRQGDPNFRWETIYRESLRDPAARRAVIAYRTRRSIEEHASCKLRLLEDLFRLHVGEPVIVFTGSNAMAREVSKQFLIPCLLSHCGKAERAEILDGLAAGDYPALVANQVLDEGVDLPEVNVAIVIGGSGSERQAKQRLGRILRKNRYGSATLYEVVSDETGEVKRSRNRRRNDAFQRTDPR